MNDSHQVITPENIELDYEIAGIGSRFLALCIDSVIQGILAIGIFYGLSRINLEHLNLEEKIENVLQSLGGVGFLFLLGFIWLGYFIILETTMNGQTIGKRILNIRVRKELGYAPDFWAVLLRNLLRMIDILPFGYAIGIFTMFLNPNAKRLGDFAAGTIVVKELPAKNLKNFLDLPPQIEEKAHPEDPGVTAQFPLLAPVVAHLSQKDYFLLKNLYSRRDQLTNYPQLCSEVLAKLICQTPELNKDAPVLESAPAPVLLKELIQRYEKTHF